MSGYENLPASPSSPNLGYGDGFGIDDGIAAKKAGTAHLGDITALLPNWEADLKAGASRQAEGTGRPDGQSSPPFIPKRM